MKTLPKVAKRTNDIAVTAVRSASCSRGWLRLVVQSIFCLITVTSFVLILLLAIRSPIPQPQGSREKSICIENDCTVRCTKVPYFDEHLEDVIDLAMVASLRCSYINLTLTRPHFTNNILPPRWLYHTRVPIKHLSINGGNLRSFNNRAFSRSFGKHIKSLSIEGLQILQITPSSFKGLDGLEKLLIKDCSIDKMYPNMLEDVSDNLRGLVIKIGSLWYPDNWTGSVPLHQVTNVDFSFNEFSEILGNSSFTQIRQCTVLNISYNHITVIRRGAFDHLDAIEEIDLSNNLLVTIPYGLFETLSILPQQTRLDLNSNLWYCDCHQSEITRLVDEGFLFDHSMCHYPEHLHGVSFAGFSKYCKKLTKSQNPISQDNSIYMNGECSNVTQIIPMRSFSNWSTNNFSCAENRIIYVDPIDLLQSAQTNIINSNVNPWIKPIFYLQTQDMSLVELRSQGSKKRGLLWYRSTCPYEVYCFNIVPNYLRMYNVDAKAVYTFCPMNVDSGEVDTNSCAGYRINPSKENQRIVRITWYIIASGLISLIVGAAIVYLIIRKYPNLLKGSKRVLIVKNKKLKALILPPKVPLRNDQKALEAGYSALENGCMDWNKKIFVLPSNNISPSGLLRVGSQRSILSSGSSAPSYISALQPTEEQLLEWRMNHQPDKYATVTSYGSEYSKYSTMSLIHSEDSIVIQ